MSDSNGFSGEITITPPLAWSEILDGPKLRDVCLRTAETVVDSDTARTTATTAQAIIPVEARYDGRYVAADIQAIVDAYGAGHTFAGWIQMQPDLGYGESTPVRYVVIDGRVETVTPRLVWPGEQQGSPPASLSPEDLAAVLRDMAAVVEARDSFGGSIQYEAGAPGMYDVNACYRVGNSMGQGGCRLVQGEDGS